MLESARANLVDVIERARTNPLFVRASFLAIAIIALDQAAKYWILYVFELPAKRSVEILPFFRLSMVWNEGVSFGLLAGVGAAAALAVFSAAVAVALLFWLTSIRRPLLAVGVGAVIGGAIGNLIDRILYGAVVDFLDFSALYFPWVFNVADSAITVGAGLILLDSFLAPKQDQS